MDQAEQVAGGKGPEEHNKAMNQEASAVAMARKRFSSDGRYTGLTSSVEGKSETDFWHFQRYVTYVVCI